MVTENRTYVNDAHDVFLWSLVIGVTPERIIRAVHEVGDNAMAVKRLLDRENGRKSASTSRYTDIAPPIACLTQCSSAATLNGLMIFTAFGGASTIGSIGSDSMITACMPGLVFRASAR